ncbi:hypothetical protein Cgig2_031555 [Carnegiea gigantea]|uniref:Uncharacterized protein n=1 Tax=Carnegiea gigantea TaxID=171969 RepID=A0A9Q1Q5F2_9CARY|nr:hypothetical protein Cgig2_031555 [Carnegiea gigantea]
MRKEKQKEKEKKEVAMALGVRILIIVALFATTVKRCSASEVILVFIRYFIAKYDLISVLTSLNGMAAIFDIANPCLEKAFSLEVHGGQHPQELTKERNPFFLTMLKPAPFLLVALGGPSSDLLQAGIPGLEGRQHCLGLLYIEGEKSGKQHTLEKRKVPLEYFSKIRRSTIARKNLFLKYNSLGSQLNGSLSLDLTIWHSGSLSTSTIRDMKSDRGFGPPEHNTESTGWWFSPQTLAPQKGFGPACHRSNQER